MVMRVCRSTMAGESWLCSVHGTRFVHTAQIRKQNNRLETGPDTEKPAPRDQLLPSISHPNPVEGLQSLPNNALDASAPFLLTSDGTEIIIVVLTRMVLKPCIPDHSGNCGRRMVNSRPALAT